jgi:asparagine synthetase B (glutamine-hydrolysing)
MTEACVVGRLDANFGWGDGTLWHPGEPDVPLPHRLRGAYAEATIAGRRVRMARDPLGLNKLFWAADPDGRLLIAARPWRLVEAGCSFESVQAIPAGTVVDLDLAQGARRSTTLEVPRRSPRGGSESAAVAAIAAELRSTLDRYCSALAAAHPRARVFVCLSGGLDSTGVMMLALDHFRDVTLVSFDLHRDNAPPSADRRTAERLASDFRVPLMPVTPTSDRLLAGLDDVLREGIDWRDFNVHAALVNDAMAREIADAVGGDECLVLTGDLPNEYLVDYHAEQLNGRTYYALPRLSPQALQAALVRGLDTSHREVGPVQARGLPAVQVYAPAVDHYLELPDAFLADPRRKDRLCRHLFGERIPDYVYTRPKTRAQVGDEDVGRGVLGLCLERGIDAAALRQRFAALHGVRDPRVLDRFIRAGRYRSSVPFTAKVA